MQVEFLDSFSSSESAWVLDALDYEGRDNKLFELLELLSNGSDDVTGSSKRKHTQGFKIDKHLLDSEEIEITTAKNCEDGDILKLRKVWSRWSKWSPCSVTCGVGVIVRKRVCVAGRCARGEREEQRRQCQRSPCHDHHESE